jgi:hypothetical protein
MFYGDAAKTILHVLLGKNIRDESLVVKVTNKLGPYSVTKTYTKYISKSSDKTIGSNSGLAVTLPIPLRYQVD